MIRPIKITLLLLPLLFTAALHAEKVFIWKDDKGVTHYSDRPAPNGKGSEVIITADDPEVIETEDSTEDLSEEASLESSPASENQASTAPSPETIAFCKKLQANMNALQAEERVRLTHDDGRVEILDDAGKEREKQRVRNMMKQFCK